MKLTDFGIGQVISAEYLAGVTKAGFTQTMVGGTSSGTGTTMYLAPEIIAGKPASTRSDIYSLGVVLYQMLIADFKRPLTTDWAEDIADRVLREDLQRCLGGKPETRFQAAGNLAENLRSWDQRKSALLRRQAEQAEQKRLYQQAERRRRRLAAAAGTVLVFAAVAVALGYGLSRAKAEAMSARRNLYAADMATTQRALAEGNRGMALRLLEAHRPVKGGADLRGFEWRYLWKQLQGDQLHVLGGHSNYVDGVAYSPSGELLASASWDGTVRLWDAAEGKPLAVLSNTERHASAVAFAPQRKVLAATSRQGVRLWDLSSFATLKDIRTPKPALPIAFSPDGHSLAVGMGDTFTAYLGMGHTTIYDADSGEVVRSLPDSGGRAVAFSNDGTTLATGPWLDQIKIWDTATGRELRSLAGAGRVLSLAFAPDGRRLASSDFDRGVRLWDVSAGRLQRTLAEQQSEVWSVAFSPDGRTLATCSSSDQCVQLWDASTCQELARLRGHRRAVFGLAFSPGGKCIATAGQDELVMLWSAMPKAEVGFAAPLRASARGLPFVAFTRDGQRMAACTPPNTITIWRTSDGVPLVQLSDTSNAVLRFLDDGRTLATILPERTLDFWDTTGQQTRSVRLENAQPESVGPVVLSPDGLLLASGHSDGHVLLRNARSGAVVRDWSAHTARLYGLQFSPDGRLLATGSYDASAKLWEVPSGRQVALLSGHRDTVEAFASSPDGRWIATASWDSSVRTWEVPSGQSLFTLAGYRTGVFSISVSADGRTLASCAESAGLWNLATQREVLALPAGTRGASFAPDGQTLALAVQEGQSTAYSLRLWGVPTLAEIDAAEKAQAGAGGQRVR